MFNIIYARSVLKDVWKIEAYNLSQIKEGIAELENFPNISKIKRLKNHPIANYRLRVRNYRILFDINWEQNEISILKIGHRKDVY